MRLFVNRPDGRTCRNADFGLVVARQRGSAGADSVFDQGSSRRNSRRRRVLLRRTLRIFENRWLNLGHDSKVERSRDKRELVCLAAAAFSNAAAGENST